MHPLTRLRPMSEILQLANQNIYSANRAACPQQSGTLVPLSASYLRTNYPREKKHAQKNTLQNQTFSSEVFPAASGAGIDTEPPPPLQIPVCRGGGGVRGRCAYNGACVCMYND